MDFSILEKALKKREIISWNNDIDVSNEDALHIAYGIDQNFVRPMGVSMTSIAENNKDLNIVFHVLIDSLKEHDLERLKQFSVHYKRLIFIHYIDDKIFKTLPATDHFTHATYNRFLLPKILAGIAKRVIYIDADILCFNSLADLMKLDFQQNTVAVVRDIADVANRQIKSLGLRGNQYFNAGFLYIDIDLWNKNQVSERALEVSFERIGKLNWLDQDALNIVLEDKTYYIELKYDYIFDFALQSKNEKLPKDVVFIHYAGRYKPWQVWCMHPLKKDFEKYSSISFWADIVPDQPKTYKDMKKMAHSYMQYGHVLLGIQWYIKYTYHKAKKIF